MERRARRQDARAFSLRHLALSHAAALLFISAAALAGNDDCGVAPAAAPTGATTRTGAYRNAAYAYALRIPAKLTAIAATPERGFTIVLSSTPRAFMDVDASYDTFYDITAQNVHRRELDQLRRSLPAVLADESSNIVLAGVPGVRFVTQLRCSSDTDVHVQDETLVVRQREIYRVRLLSTPERYASDRSRLEAMLHSWRWVKILQR